MRKMKREIEVIIQNKKVENERVIENMEQEE